MSSSVARATCSRRSSGEVVSGAGGGCGGAGGVGALAVGLLELVVSVLLDVEEVVEGLLSVGGDGGLLVCAGLASVAGGGGLRCDGVASYLLMCAGLASVAGRVCWRQRSAMLAAWDACRSPRKFWRRASWAVAGT